MNGATGGGKAALGGLTGAGTESPEAVSRGIIGSDLCFGKITMVECKEGGQREANRPVSDDYSEPGMRGSELWALTARLRVEVHSCVI